MSNPFVVGEGAHYIPFTDCYPVTVIEVHEKRVLVQSAYHKIVSGSQHDGSAEYEYSPNEHGFVVTFTLRKNGGWVQKGRPMNSGDRLLPGYRRYYDPHF